MNLTVHGYLHMNAEGDLILTILSHTVSGNKSEEIKSLLSSCKINWQRFKEFIIYHELVSVIYQGIKDFSSLFPADLMDSFKIGYYRLLAHSLYLEQEFLQIFDAFEQKGIVLLPIKGMSFLEDIYVRNFFRTMVDIDILVKEESFEEVEKVFCNLGYVKKLDGLKEEYWRKKQTHVTFYRQQPERIPIFIDLHWALDFKRKHQILPQLWYRIREVNIEGRKIKLLSSEDALFSLALHNRRFGKTLCLKYALDMVLLFKKYASVFDWDYVLKEARRGKMCSSIFFALSGAGLLGEEYIPLSIIKQLHIPAWKKRLISMFIERNIFLDSMGFKLKKLHLKNHFLLYDNLKDPIEYILNIPKEQFAKFYGLKPYDKKTDFFYKNRLFYIFFKAVLNLNRDY